MVLLAVAVTGYSIDGDCVVQENAYYKIEQCPHTLTDFTNYVNVSITNKHSQPHDLQLAFGFDTSVAKPRRAWRWGSAPHQVPTYGWVSESYVCNADFNYTIDPKYFWCYDYNGSAKFEHSFVNGWIQNKTAEWFEWRHTGYETQYWNDWVGVNNYFDAVYFQGKKWFYTPTNVSFNAGETKTLRALVQVKPNTSGKYDLFAWLGGYSAQEAWGDSSKSVLLDPWFNVTWARRKSLTLSDGFNIERFMEPQAVNFTGLTLATNNCSKELRVTANYSTETLLDLSVLDNAGESEAPGSQWCVVQFLVNQSNALNASYTKRNETNYWVYYDNAAAADLAYAPLQAWDFRYQANATPINDGWSQIGANVPSYSQVWNVTGTTNGVWSTNDTGAGVDASWYRINNAVVDQMFTVETRLRVLANSTTCTAGFGASKNADVDCLIKVQSDRAGVGNAVTSEFFNYYLLNGSEFHVYRAVCDGNGNHFTLFVDGVNRTWGSNSTNPIFNSYWLGEDYVAFPDTIQFDQDYGFIEMNRTLPSLSSALGAEEGGPFQRLFVFAFDAHTGAQLNGAFKVANSTNSSSETGWYYNKSSAVDAPSGDLTITANKTGYDDSKLYTYWNPAVEGNYSLYLFNTTVDDVVFVRFTVSDVIGQKIEGALLSVYKDFGGTLTLLTQKKTDSFGIASFYMNSKTEYVIAATHANYNDVNSTVTPVLNDYSIIMGGGGGNGTGADSYESCYTNITFYRYPRIASFFNGTTNITLTIYSNNNNLEWYGWNVTWNSTPVNYTNTSFTNSGGTL